MKYAILSVTFLFSIMAQASYMESHCSSPNAFVVYANSPSLNQLEVTLKTVTNSGQEIFEKVKLKNFVVEELVSKVLKSKDENKCGSEGRHSFEELSYKYVKISNVNKQQLNPNIVGLSEDGLSLSVDYLCQTKAEIRCP